MATLEQFLQSGVLGPIRPGMSQAEVIAVLGPPPDQSVARHPKILKYGGLQLSFLNRPGDEERGLVLIGLYFSPGREPIPEVVRPADFQGTSETTAAEVRESIARMGWKDCAIVESENADSLTLPSGARIIFAEQKLQRILFAPRTSTAPKKQISVSISEDTWKQLRILARESNRSVSQLCAEWIVQRANQLQPDNANAVTQGG